MKYSKILVFCFTRTQYFMATVSQTRALRHWIKARTYNNPMIRFSTTFYRATTIFYASKPYVVISVPYSLVKRTNCSRWLQSTHYYTNCSTPIPNHRQTLHQQNNKAFLLLFLHPCKYMARCLIGDMTPTQPGRRIRVIIIIDSSPSPSTTQL